MGVLHLVSTKVHHMYQYAYLAFVYFNGENPPLEFRFTRITRLIDLKYIIENLYTDNQRVMKLYYR